MYTNKKATCYIRSVDVDKGTYFFYNEEIVRPIKLVQLEDRNELVLNRLHANMQFRIIILNASYYTHVGCCYCLGTGKEINVLITGITHSFTYTKTTKRSEVIIIVCMMHL